MEKEGYVVHKLKNENSVIIIFTHRKENKYRYNLMKELVFTGFQVCYLFYTYATSYSVVYVIFRSVQCNIIVCPVIKINLPERASNFSEFTLINILNTS